MTRLPLSLALLLAQLTNFGQSKSLGVHGSGCRSYRGIGRRHAAIETGALAPKYIRMLKQDFSERSYPTCRDGPAVHLGIAVAGAEHHVDQDR